MKCAGEWSSSIEQSVSDGAVTVTHRSCVYGHTAWGGINMWRQCSVREEQRYSPTYNRVLKMTISVCMYTWFCTHLGYRNRRLIRVQTGNKHFCLHWLFPQKTAHGGRWLPSEPAECLFSYCFLCLWWSKRFILCSINYGGVKRAVPHETNNPPTHKQKHQATTACKDSKTWSV